MGGDTAPPGLVTDHDPATDTRLVEIEKARDAVDPGEVTQRDPPEGLEIAVGGQVVATLRGMTTAAGGEVGGGVRSR